MARNQREYEDEVIVGSEIDPSTKPNLFLAANDMSIDCFQDAKATLLKGFVMRIELRLLEGAMKKGMDRSMAVDPVESIRLTMKNIELKTNLIPC